MNFFMSTMATLRLRTPSPFTFCCVFPCVFVVVFLSAVPITRVYGDEQSAGKDKVQLAASLTVSGQKLSPTKLGVKSLSVVFLGTQCPISNRTVPALNEAAAYANKHQSKLVGVVSDNFATRSEVREFIKKYKIEFEVVFDPSLNWARALQPKVVPEAFVLKPVSSKFDIVYRGAVDDSWAGLSRPKAFSKTNFVKAAIAAITANKTPEVSFKTPHGCIFEALYQQKHQPQEPNFTRHIDQLLRIECAQCHSIILNSSDNAKARAAEISKWLNNTNIDANWSKHWQKTAATPSNISAISESGFSQLKKWLKDRKIGDKADEIQLNSSHDQQIIEAFASKQLDSSTSVAIFRVKAEDYASLRVKLPSKPDSIVSEHEVYLFNQSASPAELLAKAGKRSGNRVIGAESVRIDSSNVIVLVKSTIHFPKPLNKTIPVLEITPR